MEKIKEIIGDWIPFVAWVLIALCSLCAFLCCAVQASAGTGVFWAVCGSIGSVMGLMLFAALAFLDWPLRAENEE